MTRSWPVALRAHLESGQVARVVYGAIIGLALIAALEAHPPPPGAVVASLLGTAVAVGLAELYSDLIGARARGVTGHTGVAVEDALAAGFGIAFPVVFFLLAIVGVIEEETAFTIAKWGGLGLITFYGYCAGRLSGAGNGHALLQALAVGLIGAALIALKALVH
jgi:hypothetical protein